MVQKQRKAKPKQKVEKQTKNKLSKFIKKKGKFQKTKRDNTYVFEGFFEKLKHIDVKHSHAVDTSFIYDRLLESQDFQGKQNEDLDGTFKSNFIQYMRTEKMNNHTFEFDRVYKDLESLSFSFPLLVHNKDKVIEKLLGHLRNQKIKVIQAGILDLFIALIKDLRHDIYDDFVKRILPQAISLIDIQNVTLLDKIFTMISFGIKYLLKPIKEDIQNFYSVYSELLVSKNKYVRKFAAQSFSYVIRKVKFNEKLYKLIIKHIYAEDDVENDVIMEVDQQIKAQDVEEIKWDEINGISELIFEVIYGATEGLHSKANEILEQILNFNVINPQINMLIRVVLLKLFNEVDTQKQSPIFDSLLKGLKYTENESHLNILLQIFKDIIILKFGRRLSSLGVLQIIEVFNKLLLKNIQFLLKTCSEQTKENVSECMGILFYFKHSYVMQAFNKSMIDIQSNKNIFTHQIYQIAGDNFEILKKYMNLFLMRNDEIKSESDIDYTKMLGIKLAGSNQIEFAKDSHIHKLKLLIKSLSQHVLKQIVKKEIKEETILDNMALLEIMIETIQEKYFINLTNDLQERLIQLHTTNKDNQLARYVISKFISISQYAEGPLQKYLDQYLKQSEQKIPNLQIIDFTTDIDNNFILKQYNLNHQQKQKFNTDISQLIDYHNLGQGSLIQSQTDALIIQHLQQQLNNYDHLISILEKIPSDLITLKSINKCENLKLTYKTHQELFEKLSISLQQNQSQIRLQSLRLLKRFNYLAFKEPDQDDIRQLDASKVFNGDCQIIDLMLQFEETPIAFETEKTKILLIKKIQSQIETKLIPDQYIVMILRFLIGCFWIKFTPLFDSVQLAISELIKLDEEIFTSTIIDQLENLGYLSQLVLSNEELLHNINAKLEFKFNKDQFTQSIQLQVYKQDALLSDDYMEIKDFYYNLMKSLTDNLDSILGNQKLRDQLFSVFWNFINNEYSTLLMQKKAKVQNGSSFIDQMTYANMIDSEDYKKYRRIAYSKLYCFLELFRNIDNLLSIPNIKEFQDLMMSLLKTNDVKLQKIALECLIKTDYKQGVLKQYSRLLEGFTDDEKFKDMIFILVHGRMGSTSLTYGDTSQGYEKTAKKADKGTIPKLKDEHRLDILPIVIKLLLAKLIKKKGAINKKSIHIRRTIVFQFFSNLNPVTEFPLFFQEILEPFGLNIIDENLSIEAIKERICCQSFSQYLNFISQFDVILKNMGNLLQPYLNKLSSIFIQLLALTKLFIKQLKLTLDDNEDEKIQDTINIDQENEQTQQLYKFVGRQSKVCLRKGLGIVKIFYNKFTHLKDFIKQFSKDLFQEIIQDQLPFLSINYIYDKSQLLEILTTIWSTHPNLLINYLSFKDVIPSVMSMLQQKHISPQVYILILNLLKQLITKSVYGDLHKRDLGFMKIKIDEYTEEDNEQSIVEKGITAQIIQENIEIIAQSLHVFCHNHFQELKSAIISKGQKKNNHVPLSGGAKIGAQIKQEQEVNKSQTIRELIFIMSEVSNYLQVGHSINQDFLDMIVQIVSLRNIHNAKGYLAQQFEELLHFGCKAITNLIPKISTITDQVLDKIFSLFLYLNNIKVRETLGSGLYSSLSKIQNLNISVKVLEQLRDLNKLKRGVADMELDYDSLITTIQQILEHKFESQNLIEISSLSYSIVFLLQNEEFSVRDYALHGFKVILEHVKSQDEIEIKQYQPLITMIERQVIGYLKIQDEMILKTILEAVRFFINFFKEQQTIKSVFNIDQLSSLTNIKDENDDFFSCFLAIKLKQRQRALKNLNNKINNEHLKDFKSLQVVIMPLINYVVFGSKAQKFNRRNTITYNKDEKQLHLDEALNVYQSLASKLRWGDYYKLLKALLYRLQRASIKVQQVSSSDPEIEQEKTVTKVICKLLAGFHFETVPDAINLLKDNEEKENDNDRVDLQEVMKKLLGQQKQQQIQEIDLVEDQVDQELEQNEEDIEQLEEVEDQPKDDQEMVEENKVVEDIQDKLTQKILPILERHLMEKDQDKLIRPFVVLSIAKLIRKLPLEKFQNYLSKLVNLIVVNGLRSRQLAPREKARKALITLIKEISPQFLGLVFQEMNDQLTRGYQLHVYLYSVHHILNALNEQKILQSGHITDRIIEMNQDKLMEELFGELYEEKGVEDTERKSIKEAKAKKAIPIFEVFSQFIDFKKSFLTLLGPIVQALEDNPSFSKISQCEELLNRMSSSLLKNKSLSGEQLLLFMYTIIQRGVFMAVKVKINDERGERDYGAKVDQLNDQYRKTKKQYKEMTYSLQMKWNKSGSLDSTGANKKTQEISGRVLTSFGLQCLKKALKNKGLILNISEQENLDPEAIKEELKAKIDPFVPLLFQAFKTYHNPIVVSTLHILTLIVNLNLPSFKEMLKKFLNKIFKLFEGTNQTDTDFLNSLYKCTGGLIKTYGVYQDLSQQQIKTLIMIIKQNMNTYATQSNVFQCLKAIIYRKFICPDLYDIIEQVQEMIITNISKSVRGLCASIFVNFLLEYPLEQERIDQHLNFLLKNLAYYDQEGRLQILEVLQNLIERFPKEILDQFAELFFFTLILRLVNDNVAECRERVAHVIKRLLFNSNQAKVRSIFNTVVQMDSQNNSKKVTLDLAKLQVLGIFIESMSMQKTLKANDIKTILQISQQKLEEQSNILKQSIEKSKQEKLTQSDEDEEDLIQNSEIKSFLKSIDLIEPKKLIDVKSNQDLDSSVSSEDNNNITYYSLLMIEKLMKFNDQKVVIQQLQPQLNDLIYLSANHPHYWVRLISQRIFGYIFTYHMGLLGKEDLNKIFGFSDNKQLVDFSYQLLNTFKYLPFSEDLGNQLIKNLVYVLKYILIRELNEDFSLEKFYKRISYLGRKLMLNIQQGKDSIAMILQFFLVSITLFEELKQQKDNDLIRHTVNPILELVYRTYTDEQYSQTKVKEISLEIVDYFSNHLEKSYFVNIYKNVKEGITKKRNERKKKQKLMMATAEGVKIKANKRIKKTMKKKEKKKQKILQFELRKD